MHFGASAAFESGASGWNESSAYPLRYGGVHVPHPQGHGRTLLSLATLRMNLEPWDSMRRRGYANVCQWVFVVFWKSHHDLFGRRFTAFGWTSGLDFLAATQSWTEPIFWNGVVRSWPAIDCILRRSALSWTAYLPR
jgi:hypothetical protein